MTSWLSRQSVWGIRSTTRRSKCRLSSPQQSWGWDKAHAIVRRERQSGDLSAQKQLSCRLHFRLNWELSLQTQRSLPSGCTAMILYIYTYICNCIRACSAFRCSKLHNSEIPQLLRCFQRPDSCRLNRAEELYEVQDAHWILRSSCADKKVLPHTFKEALIADLNTCSWSHTWLMNFGTI